MDLLTTRIHHSELHFIGHWHTHTHTHTQCPQSIAVSTSRFLATDFTEGDSWACRTQVLLSQPPVRNSGQLRTQLDPRLATISHQPHSLLFTGWLPTELSHSPTSYFTSLHSTELLTRCKVKVTLRLTISQSVSLDVEPHLGLMTRYLLLFDSYGLVFVGRPLLREDASVFCIYCWPLHWTWTPDSLLQTFLHGSHRKHRSCVGLRWRGKVFTEPLLSKGLFYPPIA
jgi:hypothetical protein